MTSHSSAATPRSIVHVVDDDEAICSALNALFQSVGYETLTFASPDEFLQSGRAQAPGCLVLDIRLPRINGLDFHEHLVDIGGDMPVIFMTGHGDIQMSVRGMKAGAVDFLPKPFREQDMLDAVANAMSRDASARNARKAVEERRKRWSTLSERENQVMTLVAMGQLNKQIARDLSVAEITVKIHRRNGMRKLGTRTYTEFIKLAEALTASKAD
jgi:FixJ family two-component response regulator